MNVKKISIFFIITGLSSFINAEVITCEIIKDGRVIKSYTDKKNNPGCSVSSISYKVKPQIVSSLTTCSRFPGTVKINGKTFHLINCNDKIKHVKLNMVNSQFRQKISPHINAVAKAYNIEPAFIHAIISAESAYNPNATSKAGAMGLMQLMPFTAKHYSVTNAYDPYQNIKAGTKYLRKLLDEFHQLELAAAGYNAGEGAVRKYNNKIPPYKETQTYVSRVILYYKRYKKNPALIGIY